MRDRKSGDCLEGLVFAEGPCEAFACLGEKLLGLESSLSFRYIMKNDGLDALSVRFEM